MTKAVPPPLPVPKRTLSEPARRSISGTFELDAKTPKRSLPVVEFAAMASVFDALTSAERLELTDLMFAWKSLSQESRKRLLEQAIAEVFP